MNAKDLEAGERVIRRFVDAYNAHDVNAVVACFGEAATLQDEAWGEVFQGSDAIRRHFEAEFAASNDIRAVMGPRFASTTELAVELRIQGTHTGTWRGLPATGNTFELRSWSVSSFTAHVQHIKQNRFDYDRATVLTQLGLLHDPSSKLGSVLTALTHPVTMAKAARKRISERPAPH